MNSKRFSVIALLGVFIALLLFAGFNYMIDPLFQYHMPWFNMKPVVTNERYQNAGVAKHFDYENVIMGNSMSENFLISDANEALGGKTIKLTMSGSGALEWTKVLQIIKKNNIKPKNILFNLDSNVFDASNKEVMNDLPLYLYDDNRLNDVNYLLNFNILKSFSVQAVQKNYSNSVPDYNDVFVWANDFPYGREEVFKNFKRTDISKEIPDINQIKNNTLNNVGLIKDYITSMKDTNFIFYYSPFSMLYWDGQVRSNMVNARKCCYISSCKELIKYDNVKIYLWSDNEMLNIMSNLDNYKDQEHYSGDISKLILKRIKHNKGLVSRKTYSRSIDKLFEYIADFDYNKLYS